MLTTLLENDNPLKFSLSMPKKTACMCTNAFSTLPWALTAAFPVQSISYKIATIL